MRTTQKSGKNLFGNAPVPLFKSGYGAYRPLSRGKISALPDPQWGRYQGSKILFPSPSKSPRQTPSKLCPTLCPLQTLKISYRAGASFLLAHLKISDFCISHTCACPWVWSQQFSKKFEVRSFTPSWDNRGYQTWGQSLDTPTLHFYQIFRDLFGWTLWMF